MKLIGLFTATLVFWLAALGVIGGRGLTCSLVPAALAMTYISLALSGQRVADRNRTRKS